MIKEIKPKEAFSLLEQQKNAVLIDVRSTMEYSFVGHPINAIHVPLREPPDWKNKPEFVATLRETLAATAAENSMLDDTPLFMLCRSGARSMLAAEMLVKDGFTRVYNIAEGFEGDRDDSGHRNTINGWRFHDLPWEQS